MANWRMCCMVSDGESLQWWETIHFKIVSWQYWYKHWSPLTSFYWESGSVACSWVSVQWWERANVFRCTRFSRQKLLVSYPEWCCFYTRFYSLVNIFPPLAGTLIWCPFNVLALIKFHLTFYSCVQPFSCWCSLMTKHKQWWSGCKYHCNWLCAMRFMTVYDNSIFLCLCGYFHCYYLHQVKCHSH